MLPLLVVSFLSVAVVAADPNGGGGGGGGTYDSGLCESSTPCGDHVEIKYPFYLSNATGIIDGNRDGRCGYPGLGIVCEGGDRAILRLGNYNYNILDINHGNHTVTVADSDVLDGGGDCPRVRHNVTIPPAVLSFPVANNDSISFFFDCNFTADGFVRRPSPPIRYLKPISCSSFEERRGLPSYVAAKPDVGDDDSWFWMCEEVVVAPVIRDWLSQDYDRLGDVGYGAVLKRGFQLSWDPTAGMCHDCEESGGRCSYGRENEFLGCLCSDGHVSKPDCGVDYVNKLLVVIDQNLPQEGCLQRYRSTSIDESKFMYTDRDQFLKVYVNCSANPASLPLAVDLISCLAGGSSYYRLDNSSATDVLGSCSSTIVVPYNSTMTGSIAAGNSSLEDVIRGGFTVRWKAGIGWCSDCKVSGGRCGFNGGFPDDFTCYCPHGQAIGSCSSSGSKSSRKRTIEIATSIAAGVLLILLLVVVSFLYLRKRRQYKTASSSSRLLKYSNSGGTPQSRGNSDMESGSFNNLQMHHFAYEELEEATGGFSDDRELGDGGFGTVYKGQLRDGRVVAVKRLYNNSYRRVEQFVNEAAILSRLRHPNLVLFYGCTSSRSRELLLVYEFVPNGTVADHLHGRRAPERALTWPVRLNIAVEAAAALSYLHAVEPQIVHRDVKTNNILLDADFHVKVADFGLSRLFPLDVTHVSTAPQGTPGYVDPEYHQCYQLTDKSDVYSFGVVLVELISSKPAVDVTRDRDEINLAGMAINKIQRCQVDQLVDHELGYSSDQATRKMMTVVAELAFRCLQHNGEMRPPIKEVFDVLRGIQDEFMAEKGGKIGSPCSPNTVHARWDSMSTTPSISQ